jgi:hypothetical protein
VALPEFAQANGVGRGVQLCPELLTTHRGAVRFRRSRRTQRGSQWQDRAGTGYVLVAHKHDSRSNRDCPL